MDADPPEQLVDLGAVQSNIASDHMDCCDLVIVVDCDVQRPPECMCDDRNDI